MRVELFACAAVVAIAAASPAQAQSDARRYDIEEQDLASALRRFSAVSGREVLAPAELVAGKRSGAVRGRYAADDALGQLLEGTGLRVETVEGAFVLRPFDGALAQEPQEAETESEILVTGSRIRGAPVASPVIALDQESIRDAGQATVADAVRTIPQNFGGGQNPGVGFNVPAASGVNVGGGASINLRGLGSDATLTLLNGHRLSYSASRQSIDISTIPLAAVDRIEIVADGASALYGSDAVAGVANIILKRDFSGVEARGRLGGSTDGGNFRQLYGLTGGGTWDRGGLLASYEYGRDTPVLARQRAYGGGIDPELTFLPALERHSFIGSGHQALGRDVEFAFDGFYNWRSSRSRFLASATSRAENPSTAESFALAPSLRLSLGGWRVNLVGSYGEDHVTYVTNTYSLAGVETSTSTNIYRNSARAIEANADGALFALPGGSAKLAIGAGYRDNRFENFRGVGSSSNIDRGQDSTFAYGELSLPLISSANGVPLVDRLNLSAAVRYERYPGVDTVATPKLGLVYGPSPDFEFKASWGQSFRAPTFFQRYQLQSVYLAPPSIFGGSGYPANATVLYAAGGNAALRPERATSWSATFVAHPRAIPGLRFEASYFSIRYRDRIVAPITFLSQALSNPIYRDRIVLTPSASTQAAVIAGGGEFLNLTAGAYDPANVVAIVNNANFNAGRQTARGVDIFASYRAELGDGQALLFTANASYLESDQQLSSAQPVLPLAGLVFNPPHWRGRSTLAWVSGGFRLEAAVDYVGGVDDARRAPTQAIGAMTTADLTARYRIEPGPDLFDGIDLTLSVSNVFDTEPHRIATTLPYDAPYDSTNYSPVGRFISIGIAKRW
ncbi:TonB-dependent receptor domain-containing protein [Sphingomonas canadensis]|uniref:TonB-dependent receptor domain-containing protein n=1 Tax=Sphingomonas canadensis TaxID=1219257 RepID=A0ABW3H4I6_9SPHN|nr:TonB-dependent receptor [Sphingomonas canadensis]MCW3835026.1 TonB-dependent receptor [Sphingomonas canadensis]